MSNQCTTVYLKLVIKCVKKFFLLLVAKKKFIMDRFGMLRKPPFLHLLRKLYDLSQDY